MLAAVDSDARLVPLLLSEAKVNHTALPRVQLLSFSLSLSLLRLGCCCRQRALAPRCWLAAAAAVATAAAAVVATAIKGQPSCRSGFWSSAFSANPSVFALSLCSHSLLLLLACC